MQEKIFALLEDYVIFVFSASPLWVSLNRKLYFASKLLKAKEAETMFMNV